jgi:peptide/nickel transport system substrate-binding protein
MPGTFQATVRALALVAGLGHAVACHASTLRIGLVSDPDGLDPAFARVWSTTIVLNSICDKLIDLTPDYRYVPRLATHWSWSDDGRVLELKLRPGVRFHDGEPFNAAAVKYTLERYRNTRGSTWVVAYTPITSIEVVDDLTVRIAFSASLSSRIFGLFVISGGMMISPKSAEAAGDRFGAKPICAGPYRFVERVAHNQITLERFADYWDRDRVHIGRIVYRIVPDSTVRMANLLAGALDLIEQVPPADVPRLAGDRRFKVAPAMSLGHSRIYINVGRGERANSPLGRDARLRQAFSLSIDRDALNNVIFEGQFVPAASWVPPGSTFHLETIPPVRRDLERAKALLAEAGIPNPKVELSLPNIPVQLQVAEMIQAMTREAGFETTLRALETGTAVQRADRGDYQAMLLMWPGLADPDQNVSPVLACNGSVNYSGYCNASFDRLLEEARASRNVDDRVRLYTKASEMLSRDEPYIFLYHHKWIWAHSAKLKGFVAHPDGITRVMDLKFD